MKHRTDIDGLRALAILPVVAFHFDLQLFGRSLAAGGFVGVDVFFVISGYLITSIIYREMEGGRFSIFEFYNRRVRRIFPALFVVLAICLCAAFFWLFPFQYAEIARNAVAAIFFVSNVIYFHEAGYFSAAAERNPLLHTWSLSVEEQFYIFLPIFLFFAFRLPRRTHVPLLAIFGAISFAAALWMTSTNREAAFYLVQYRAWELIIGSLLAVATLPVLRRRWMAELCAAVGVLLILASVLLLKASSVFPGLGAVPACLGTALVLYAGMPTHGAGDGGYGSSTFTARCLGWWPVRFIGLISFSLYLWHWPLIVFVRQFDEPSLAGRYGLVALAVLLAAASWRFIEQPFRVHTGRYRTRTVLAGGVGVMAALSCAAFVFVPVSASYWHLSPKVEQVLGYLDKKVEVEPQCFLTSANDSFDAYDRGRCLALSGDKPNVLVLGDSHAAHLVPGLRQVGEADNLLIATASGCKPVVNTRGRSRCVQLVNYILRDFLPAHHLDAIVLSARWTDADLADLKRTLAVIEPFADRIIVSGPIVEYEMPLPYVLARKLNDPTYDVDHHRVAETAAIDEHFQAAVTKRTIRYFSPYRALCGSGCALWAAEGVPMQFDYGHLTLEGSRRVATLLLDDLPPARPTAPRPPAAVGGPEAQLQP